MKVWQKIKELTKRECPVELMLLRDIMQLPLSFDVVDVYVDNQDILVLKCIYWFYGMHKFTVCVHPMGETITIDKEVGNGNTLTMFEYALRQEVD
jgi:hypothetical protein